jgi:hypothetical protein
MCGRRRESLTSHLGCGRSSSACCLAPRHTLPGGGSPEGARITLLDVLDDAVLGRHLVVVLL